MKAARKEKTFRAQSATLSAPILRRQGRKVFQSSRCAVRRPADLDTRDTDREIGLDLGKGWSCIDAGVGWKG
jgi:hypothetical protein